MRGEDVHRQASPPHSGPADALPHEHFAVKVPEGASMGKGLEFGGLDGVFAEDDESRAAERQHVSAAVLIEHLEVRGVGHGLGQEGVIGPVPDLLQQDYVIVADGDDLLEGLDSTRFVFRPRPTQAPGVQVKHFQPVTPKVVFG